MPCQRSARAWPLPSCPLPLEWPLPLPFEWSWPPERPSWSPGRRFLVVIGAFCGVRAARCARRRSGGCRRCGQWSEAQRLGGLRRRAGKRVLREQVVRREREEIGKLGCGDELVEERGGLRVAAGGEGVLAVRALDRGELLAHDGAEQRHVHG